MGEPPEPADTRRKDNFVVVRSHEGVKLIPYDTGLAKAIESTRDYMRRHRKALQELAKK